MAQEMPTLSKSKRTAVTNAISAYAPSITNTSGTTAVSYTGTDFALGNTAQAAMAAPNIDAYLDQIATNSAYERLVGAPMRTHNVPQPTKEKKVAQENKRRIVKVIVIDPDLAMPIKDCVLFSGDEKLTELDDQELFFELNINEMLATHNAKRVQVTDKKASDKAGRDIKLEPARVRDLKMSVVEVASF